MIKRIKRTHSRFGYLNYRHLMATEPNAEVIAHAESVYDKWTKYLLKHPSCPAHITEQYAQSPVWYQRFAAVMPKNKYLSFKHLLTQETDLRVLRALHRAEEINWGN